MNYLYKMLIIILYFSILGCKVNKINTSLNSKYQDSQIDIVKESKDQLIFLVFNIKKIKEKEYSNIELIKKEQVEGKIKTKYQENETYENHLTIYQFENQSIIDSIVCQHPLYKELEEFNGNTMSLRQIELDSASFFVRLQLSSKTNEIQIFEKLKQNNPFLIKSIKL